MAKQDHRPTRIISVTSDENFNPRCLMCDVIVPVDAMMMLLRKDSNSDWSAVCLDCASGMMGLVIAEDIHTIFF